MNLLSHAFSIARKEWKWIAASSTKYVSRPRKPPARKPYPGPGDRADVLLRSGYDGGLALEQLRRDAYHLRTADDIGRWRDRARELTLDPF